MPTPDGFAPDLREHMQRMITAVDAWLDAECGPAYKEQPLAQTWARLCKFDEEHGETIAELILASGQNPRKEGGSRHAIVSELADRACASIFGIQHLTKNSRETLVYLLNAMDKAASRASEAGYPS